MIIQSLLQTIVTFIWQNLHHSHTYLMIILPCLCGFWVHINVVFCNDSEKIFPGICGKYAIINKIFERGNSYVIAYVKTSVIWYGDAEETVSIVFALMVISFNPTYNSNGASRFLRFLRFANEVSLVCTILDCFLYENINSWETDKAAWLTLVGVGSAPSISSEHKLKRGNGMDSCWQLTGKFPWKELVTSDICLRISRTTFSSAFAREDWFFLNIFFTRSFSCEYVMVFLRSSFWSIKSGRASSKRLWIVKYVVKREFYLIWEVHYTWIVILLQQRKIFHACCIVPLQNVLFFENKIPQKISRNIWCCSFLLYCCWILIVKSH